MNMKKLQQNLKNEVKYIRFKEYYEDLINETPEIKNDLELFELELNKSVDIIIKKYEDDITIIFDRINEIVRSKNMHFCSGLYGFLMEKIKILKR